MLLCRFRTSAITSWDHLQMPARRLRDAEVPSVISPRIRHEGQPGEHAAMFFSDFSAKPIEFKSFKHLDYLFRSSFLQGSNQDR